MQLRLFAATIGLLFPAFAIAASGALAVTASSALSETSSIPQGAQRMPLLEVSFAADCQSDVTVSELVVRHAGLGSARDLARLYVMADGRRLTRGVVPSDRHALTLRLRSFVVPACASRMVSITADVSPTAAAAGEHRLMLESVAADVPVTISTAANSSARATVTPSVSSPQIEAEFLTVHTSQLYGSNRTLARVRLTNIGERSQGVTAITLTNNGSARDADLRNLALYGSDGQRLTTEAAQMDGSLLRLSFEVPLFLSRSDEKLLELRGDVRASRKRTIDYTIEELSDIEAAEVHRR